MARNAVAHLAKTGQVDEEPLFEERGKWIVQISEAGKAPEVGDDLGILGREPEEVGQYTEALLNARSDPFFGTFLGQLR